jgi:penicillin-binding protein 1A
VWRPVNEGQISGRTMTLADALTYSKNTITAQLIDRVGVSDVVRQARRMGIRQSEMDRVPSIALGTSEVTLLEMVSVYGTIANEGVYQQPILVSRIDDRDGNVLATFEPESDRVMSEESAVALTDMMRGVVDRGTGARVRSTFGIRADVAGKTGTTQDNADGWFILMHPDLIAGAWVGFNDPRVAFRSNYWGSGGNNALFIVGEFFDRALSMESLGLGDSRFAPPPEYEDEEEGGFGPVGRWFDRAFRNVGRWVGRALDAASNAIFGEEPEQGEDLERPTRRV